jgi:hypothetical protein
MKALLVALLLLLALPAHAANTAFATVDPQASLRNPVMGGVGFEGRSLRASIAFGNNDLTSGSLDLYRRSGKTGLYGGIGVVADRIGDEDYTVVTSSSADSVVVRKHDNGKHKGDKHVRGGKVVVLNRTFLSTASLLGQEFGLQSSLFIGVSNPTGLFAESRVLFNGDEVSNRVSVGLRW